MVIGTYLPTLSHQALDLMCMHAVVVWNASSISVEGGVGALGGILHSLNPNDQVMFQKYYQAVSNQRRNNSSNGGGNSNNHSSITRDSSHAKMAAAKFATTTATNNKRARAEEDLVTDPFTFAMEGNGVAGPADDYVPASTAAQQLHFFRCVCHGCPGSLSPTLCFVKPLPCSSLPASWLARSQVAEDDECT